MRHKALGQVAGADFVEHVEGVDQQAFMLCRRIGDRVDVGGIFAVVPALEAQRRIDANAACIEG
jgi:hypothetical protein